MKTYKTFKDIRLGDYVYIFSNVFCIKVEKVKVRKIKALPTHLSIMIKENTNEGGARIIPNSHLNYTFFSDICCDIEWILDYINKSIQQRKKMIKTTESASWKLKQHYIKKINIEQDLIKELIYGKKV